MNKDIYEFVPLICGQLRAAFASEKNTGQEMNSKTPNSNIIMILIKIIKSVTYTESHLLTRLLQTDWQIAVKRDNAISVMLRQV